MNCTNCGKDLRPGIRFCGNCGLPAGESSPAPAAREAPEPAVIDPMLGRLVLNQFRILRRIGGGGMGTAYLAEQIGMDRLAVVKVLHPHLLGDALWVERFNREAKVASKLSHPNSITLYNYGRTDEGYAFIAMEYVDGRSLSELVQTEAPLDPERAVDIATQICGALQQAHELGIVHRDLKSENILFTERGRREVAKVLDFGIAKMQGGDPDEPQLTATGMVFGTPAYMSPEQFTGSQLDGRSDLYSLGVILYEMLSGRRPFNATSPIGYFRLHQDSPPPPLRVSNPAAKVPLALEQVVLRALEKEPARRHEDADAMAKALQDALRQPSPANLSESQPSESTEDAFPRLQRDDEVAAWLDSFESTASQVDEASSPSAGGGTFLDRLEAAGVDPPPASSSGGSGDLELTSPADERADTGGPGTWSAAGASLPEIGPEELALIVDQPPNKAAGPARSAAPLSRGSGSSSEAALDLAPAPPLSLSSNEDLLVVGREPPGGSQPALRPSGAVVASLNVGGAQGAANGGRRSAAPRGRVSAVTGSGAGAAGRRSRGATAPPRSSRDSLAPESNTGQRRAVGGVPSERPRTLNQARSAASPEHARRLAQRALLVKVAILAGVFVVALAAAYLSPLRGIIGGLGAGGADAGSRVRRGGRGGAGAAHARGPSEHGVEDMAAISGGPSQVGHPSVKESHPRRVELRPFLIDEHEVSNTRYRVCAVAGRCFQPAFWGDGRFAGPRHPVVGVSFEEARAYCKFRGLRLPYASEWERAARGPRSQLWPWGDAFVAGAANLAGAQDGFGLTAPVHRFADGASAEGVLNLIGNAAEWVLPDPPEYQGRRRPGRGRPEGGDQPTVRGGSFLSEPENASAVLPGEELAPSTRRFNIGFRCARDASPEEPPGDGD